VAGADVFGAIASPVRRQVLDLLRRGPLRAGEVAAAFDMSRPAVSQHLGVLRSAGLISEERVGRERRYRIDGRPLREVAAWAADYERFWQDRLAALEGLLEEKYG
jgi:DNA-binding transcriptional ArsR family regulator